MLKLYYLCVSNFIIWQILVKLQTCLVDIVSWSMTVFVFVFLLLYTCVIGVMFSMQYKTLILECNTSHSKNAPGCHTILDLI